MPTCSGSLRRPPRGAPALPPLSRANHVPSRLLLQSHIVTRVGEHCGHGRLGSADARAAATIRLVEWPPFTRASGRSRPSAAAGVVARADELIATGPGSGLPGRVVAMQFGGDGVAQLVPAVLELGEAFALELSGDVLEVDAGGCQLIQDAARIVVPARDGVAGHLAMAGEGGQGGSGHGVDGAGGDEFGYVHGVGIGVVLDAGG